MNGSKSSMASRKNGGEEIMLKFYFRCVSEFQYSQIDFLRKYLDVFELEGLKGFLNINIADLLSISSLVFLHLLFR